MFIRRVCPKCGYGSILTEDKIDVGWSRGYGGRYRVVYLCRNFECCTAYMILQKKKVLLGSYPRQLEEISRLSGVKVA
jgi:ribosomal protein S27AE